jgi:hypothetical protein
VHLEKPHQRPADRHIVFNDEYEAGGILGHKYVIVAAGRVTGLGRH